MKVYSRVPSQRSQATVSAMKPKTMDRKFQKTAPIMSVRTRSGSSWLDADEGDGERAGRGVDEPGDLPAPVATGQEEVALDEGEARRELTRQGGHGMRTPRECGGAGSPRSSGGGRLPRLGLDGRADADERATDGTAQPTSVRGRCGPAGRAAAVGEPPVASWSRRRSSCRRREISGCIMATHLRSSGESGVTGPSCLVLLDVVVQGAAGPGHEDALERGRQAVLAGHARP